MKKFIRTAAMLSIAMFSFSCEKELTPGLVDGEPTHLTKCTLSASFEDNSKVTVSGLKSSWETGDKIALVQYGRYVGDGANRDNTRNEFTALASGNKVMFSGTVANYKVRDTSKDASASSKSAANTFSILYPYSALSAYNSGSSVGSLTVPSTQTGQLSDLGKYVHYNISFTETETNTSYDSENEILTISASPTLVSVTPVLKFNIPSNLEVARIEIFGRDENGLSKGITGLYKMRLNGKTSSFVAPADTVITIENEGNVISGETYVVLAPTSMTDTRALQNDAKTLVFKIYSRDGGVARLVGRVNGTVAKNKVIKDLGSFPSSLEYKYEGTVKGELCLLPEKTLSVALRDTTAGSSFYFTTGFGTCADPTESSNKFFASSGFSALSLEGSTLVKVLVHHPKYEDKILSALVRRYDLKSPNLLYTDLTANGLSAYGSTGDTKEYDGLKASNRNDGEVKSFSGTSYLQFESGLYFSFAPLNASNVSVYLKLASNTSSKARSFEVYKSNVDGAKRAGGATVATLADATDVGTSSCGRAVDLGAMAVGDSITIWHNGGSRVYSYAIMEQSETLSVIPTAPSTLTIPVTASGLPTTSATANKSSDTFYCNGLPFTVSEVTSGDGYVSHWCSSTSIFNWKINGEMESYKFGCIELPVINGYTLTQVTFDTSSKNKKAYVTSDFVSSPKDNNIGNVSVPQTQVLGTVQTINVTDPGNLTKYYFIMTLSTDLNVRDLTLYYKKK